MYTYTTSAKLFYKCPLFDNIILTNMDDSNHQVSQADDDEIDHQPIH